MQDLETTACQCLDCAGETCGCGCQARNACDCGPACNCGADCQCAAACACAGEG